MHETPAIQTQKLSKSYGKLDAVNHVSLTVKPKEIYALIGPNGAGKTTLIKLLVGLLTPTFGSVEICGHDIVKYPMKAKEQFGYVSDDPNVYEYLSGMEFLDLTGKLRQIPPQLLSKRIDDLSKLFPFDQLLTEPASRYSRGNKQKLALIASFLANSKVLIIDEPIVGLDPASIDIFGAKLQEFAHAGGAVLFATHTLAFAQIIATKVGLMKDGKIILEEKVKTVKLEKLYQKYLNS